jgi:hypothetical protein
MNRFISLLTLRKKRVDECMRDFASQWSKKTQPYFKYGEYFLLRWDVKIHAIATPFA